MVWGLLRRRRNTAWHHIQTQEIGRWPIRIAAWVLFGIGLELAQRFAHPLELAGMGVAPNLVGMWPPGTAQPSRRAV